MDNLQLIELFFEVGSPNISTHEVLGYCFIYDILVCSPGSILSFHFLISETIWRVLSVILHIAFIEMHWGFRWNFVLCCNCFFVVCLC